MASFKIQHEEARKRLDTIDTELESLLLEIDELTMLVESGAHAVALLELRKATRLVLQGTRIKLDSLT